MQKTSRPFGCEDFLRLATAGQVCYTEKKRGGANMEVILKENIACQLRKVGLERGDTVMVHTSLKRMGYVCGGAQTVIEAREQS